MVKVHFILVKLQGENIYMFSKTNEQNMFDHLIYNFK